MQRSSTFVTTSDSRYLYHVSNNIDMNNEAFIPIGTSIHYAFKGTFDGNGKTISKLTLNSASGYAGLFGYPYDGATIKNLTIDQADITVTSIGYSGFISARNTSADCTISNCHVTNSTMTTTTGKFVAATPNNGNATAMSYTNDALTADWWKTTVGGDYANSAIWTITDGSLPKLTGVTQP